MKTALPLAAAALMIAAASGAAVAQAPLSERAVQGKQVAAHFCNECHAVEAGGASPLKAAPPMSELYRTFPVERLDEALKAGLIDRHSTWLQQKLDPAERAALTEYVSMFAPAGRVVEPPAEPLPTRGMIFAALGW